MVRPFSGVVRWLIGLFLPASFAATQEMPLKFDRYSLNEGLSQSQVFDLGEDEDGFLWLATADGLNRFDGYEFRVFRNSGPSPLVTDNFIMRFVWQRGRVLWVGTDAGGLHRIDAAQDPPHVTVYRHNLPDPASLSHNRILCLRLDGDSLLWVGTNGGLDAMELPGGRIRRVPLGREPPPQVNAVLISNDAVWAGTSRGLVRLDRSNGHATTYVRDAADPHSLSENSVIDLGQDADGRLWIGTLGGGLNVMASPGRFVHYAQRADVPGSLSDDRVLRIFRDKEGTMWVGTGGGLNRARGNDAGNILFERYTFNASDPNSLPANDVRALYQDRAGNLWIGTSLGGVCRFHPGELGRNRFRHYSLPAADDKESNRTVWSFAEGDAGSVFVGTWGSGLFRHDRSGTVTRVPTAGFMSSYVWSLRKDRSGSLWVGTLYRPLAVSVRGTPFAAVEIAVTTTPGGRYPSASALLEDRSGDLWIGTWGSGVFRRPAASGKVERVPLEREPDGPSLSALVYVLYEDRDGRIWVGTEGQGLYAFDPRTQQTVHYTHHDSNPSGLSDNRVYAVHRDRRGVVWIGTYGGGLNRLDPSGNTWKRYTEQDGWPSNVVYAIVEDRSGYLWMTTHRGLVRFNPANESVRTYTVQDGLQSNEFTGAFLADSRGDLWFGGINGYNRFNPDSLRTGTYQPPVVLTSWRIRDSAVYAPLNGQTVPTIDLFEPDNRIELEFTALDFTQPERNAFACRLVGLDDRWQLATTRRFASYTNLPGGEYIFEVRAANPDGIWSDRVLRVPLIVHPPFWKATWFKLAGLVLLAAAAIFIYRGRMRAVEKRQAELERLVESRTREIREKNEQIKQQHMQIMHAEKMASLGRVVAGMAHELNNPLGVMLGNLEHAQGMLKEPSTIDREELENTIQASIGGGERIKKILSNLFRFSNLDAPDERTVDLTQSLQTILDLFLGQFPSIEIRTEFAELPPVRLLTGQFNLAVLNLLTNAVQAIQDKRAGGGTIWMSTSEKTIGQGRWVTIRIRDNGVGIPNEHVHKIFDPFFTTRDVGRGYGLGLSEAYGIIQRHGGKIEVRSTPGEGSEFEMLLPAERLARA
jgi:signal transduction histidine kinase/ligand-binding sensor domain-containing protein